MDIGHPSTVLLPAGIALLIGWRMYGRIRRMVGRQRLSNVRPWLTVVLFPLLLALLMLGSLTRPASALALAAGAVAGAALGRWGLHLTKFEATPLGLFYTPNAHLGIALSLLLIVRIAYRYVQVYALGGAAGQPSTALLRSPLTLLLFGTLAGYYVSYAVGLLRWRRAMQRELAAASTRGAADAPSTAGSR